MPTDNRYSRPIAAAVALGDLAHDRHRFLDKCVLVTGESGILATRNGLDCLIDSLRLLIRICPNIFVSLPNHLVELREECRKTIGPLAFGREVQYLERIDDLRLYDAILSVGATVRPELPWTVINSNGWVARVSSGRSNLPRDCRNDNPVGALGAASLGVADVFKRLICLRESRGSLANGLSFSLYTYRTCSQDYGPALPADVPLRLLLVGAGAIGNGITYLLSKLPVSGTVWIIDPQDFGPENLGTCLLIGPANVGAGKAPLAESILQPRLSAQGFREDLATFEARLGSEIPYPRIVIGAVDSIDARHHIQGLWPDLVIDGAISDFGCQVSRHPWGDNVACLRCLFQQTHGESAEQVGSRLTGLDPVRAQQRLEKLTEEDVRRASPDKQGWLGARIGRQICSVLEEAIAQHLSHVRQRAGFQPSVPFVACFSASMIVSELVKYVAGWSTSLEPRFQFDILRGAEYGLELPQERRQDCVCVTRRRNIEIWRSQRSEGEYKI